MALQCSANSKYTPNFKTTSVSITYADVELQPNQPTSPPHLCCTWRKFISVQLERIPKSLPQPICAVFISTHDAHFHHRKPRLQA